MAIETCNIFPWLIRRNQCIPMVIPQNCHVSLLPFGRNQCILNGHLVSFLLAFPPPSPSNVQRMRHTWGFDHRSDAGFEGRSLPAHFVSWLALAPVLYIFGKTFFVSPAGARSSRMRKDQMNNPLVYRTFHTMAPVPLLGACKQ